MGTLASTPAWPTAGQEEVVPGAGVRVAATSRRAREDRKDAVAVVTSCCSDPFSLGMLATFSSDASTEVGVLWSPDH